MNNSNIALVVDDNHINRKLISSILKKKGLTVVTAANEKESIEKFKKQDISIVFMDIMLPQESGFEVAEKLLSISKNNIPVIGLSSNDDFDHTKIKNHGLSDFLLKPIKEQELDIILEKYVFQNNTKNDVVFDEVLFESFYPDKSLRLEIVNLFLNDNIITLDSIKNAFSNDDLDALYQKLHYLKGSLIYLKAMRLLKLNQRILDWCKTNDVQYIQDSENEFIANYQILRDTLREYLIQNKE